MIHNDACRIPLEVVAVVFSLPFYFVVHSPLWVDTTKTFEMNETTARQAKKFCIPTWLFQIILRADVCYFNCFNSCHPGDSGRPFYPLVGGHLILERVIIPKGPQQNCQDTLLVGLIFAKYVFFLWFQIRRTGRSHQFLKAHVSVMFHWSNLTKDGECTCGSKNWV